MAKRIYSIVAIIAIIIIISLILSPQLISISTKFWIVSIVYALFVGSIHGLLAHSVSAKQKDSLVVYPLLMGMLFTALLLVYIYLVMPFVLPGFM